MRKGLSGPAGTSPCTRGHVLGPGSPSGPQCHAAFCVPPLPSRDHLHCCPTLSQTPPCRLPRRLCPLETTHGPVALPAPGLPLLRAVWGPSCCQEGCEHHTCSSRGWEPGHHLPVSPRRFRESSGCLGCSTASSPRDTGQSPSLAPQCREGPRERAAPWVQRAPGRPCHPLTGHLSPPPAGMLMVCIVIGARKLGLNPDNIATPIAASLGDLITLSILALVSSFFHKHRGRARGWGLSFRRRGLGSLGRWGSPPRCRRLFQCTTGTGVSGQQTYRLSVPTSDRGWSGCFSTSSREAQFMPDTRQLPER